VGLPTEVAGVEVSLGDWVIGDADGVVVVHKDRLLNVLAAAKAREEKEGLFFAALRSGATTAGLLSLDITQISMRWSDDRNQGSNPENR
jgi:4-hydroxy-4-methyl-2-oxoglutarate aldolase